MNGAVLLFSLSSILFTALATADRMRGDNGLAWLSMTTSVSFAVAAGVFWT